ncbi:hypothetical protein [Herbaspirillum seropedicae]|uniref:hypothetical protein n=1 Tax=Herbaspirillum seropedicae TaxID=964 RepID=UPI003FCC4926
MALLPNRNLFDGTKSPKPTTAEMKTAWATMRDFLAALLGTDSDDKPGARVALGVSSVEEVQAGKSVFAVATGTGDALVVALTPTLLALVDGMELHVRCPASNGTTAPTLKVDALDPLPIVGGDGGPLVANAYRTNWPAVFRYRKAIGAASAAFELLNPVPVIAGAAPPVRQTVLSGSVDANGYANFLSAGSGLNVSVVASSTPLELTAANGTSDRKAAVSANQTIGVTANATNYLYADIASDGTAIFGATTVAPVYQYGGAGSSASGAFVFNYGRMTQTVGNGSAAVASSRVYIGEAVAGASSVTNVVSYALNGRYKSAPVSFTTSTQYAFSHNIGVPVENLVPNLFVKQGGDASYTPITSSYDTIAPNTYPCWTQNAATRTSISTRSGTGGYWIGGNGVASGTIIVAVQRGW